MNEKISLAGDLGSGKSTVAKALARDYNILYLDTGAMYRAVTLYALEHGAFTNGILNDDKLIVRPVKKPVEVMSDDNATVKAAWEAGEVISGLVEKEIKGEMKESFSVIRENGKDKKSGAPVYEMQTFYLIDEDAASEARIRAFENAMRESAAAQKHAEMVSKFIQEGFEVEQ